MTKRFAAVFDVHRGYEIRHGHKYPIHDPKAWGAVLKFLDDFKPHHLIFGGDILDTGVISHHNHGRPRRVEGMRLIKDAEECRQEVIHPALATLVSGGDAEFLVGNHEDWLEDLLDREPGLEGALDLRRLLGLSGVKMIPSGGVTHLGKLWFAHGDQIRGGEHAARAAVTYFNRSIRIGHYHTFQVFTATSAVDNELPNTGMVVPCLCTKDPAYNEGKPNRWAQGFLWGYIFDDGTYADQVAVIIRGRFWANGKLYTD